jgi:hypothetical protein
MTPALSKAAAQIMTDETPALACSLCALYESCGGLRGTEAVWDCFEPCHETCTRDRCDWVCPFKPDYWERALEIGGFRESSHFSLRPLLDRSLPLYVPQVIHGKRRNGPLPTRIVAVPTFSAITGDRERYGAALVTPAALRERFRLSPSAEVLLLSVAPDRQLERYWRWRRYCHMPERLAKLGAFAMTLPNFSLFKNAPRTHWHFNRTRMLCTGEELSNAGLPIVPHLNASTSTDWQYWERMLKHNAYMQYVCKEFQTGLAPLEAGRKAIDALVRLQDRVGRDLYPIIIGGTRFLEYLVGKFRAITFVDSNPFMATMHRRRYELRDLRRIKKIAHPTATGAPLDELLEVNLQLYESWVLERAKARSTSSRTLTELCAPVEPDKDREVAGAGAAVGADAEFILS